MGNKTLDAARAARLDEFHTRYGDALAGLEPFRDRLAGADILLDTNDGDWSAFWRVLSDRFDEWRIGRVRSVSWDPDWDTLFVSDDGGGRVFERTRHGVTERRLACAGSIDDDKVLAMAHEADLVVGNPPFSRMSDYLPDRADADLLCLGPLTAAAYRSVFPLVLSGRLHIASGNRGAMSFSSPAAGRLNPSALTRDGLVQVRGVVWYTTLPGRATDVHTDAPVLAGEQSVLRRPARRGRGGLVGAGAVRPDRVHRRADQRSRQMAGGLPSGRYVPELPAPGLGAR